MSHPPLVLSVAVTTSRCGAVLQDFSLADYEYLVHGWEAKVVRCGAGLQKWGLFTCAKPL